MQVFGSRQECLANTFPMCCTGLEEEGAVVSVDSRGVSPRDAKIDPSLKEEADVPSPLLGSIKEIEDETTEKQSNSSLLESELNFSNSECEGQEMETGSTTAPDAEDEKEKAQKELAEIEEEPAQQKQLVLEAKVPEEPIFLLQSSERYSGMNRGKVEDESPDRPSVRFNDQIEAQSKQSGQQVSEEEPQEKAEVDERRELIKASVAATCTAIVSIAVIVIFRIYADANSQIEVCEAMPASERVLLRSCEICGRGTMTLPLGGDWEKAWHPWARSCLYFVGLIWFFMGVGVICDEFMGAIETITGREWAVWIEGADGVKRRVHFTIWNSTLANLSLMALGSSAPEIMLSSVELVSNGFYAGSLGPQTVVGSAAFNLFCITSVCISAIPFGEVRKIEKIKVFCFTAATSVLAYTWILVMVVWITPDKIDIVEGAITLAMFIAFLVIAVMLDRCESEEVIMSVQEEIAIKRFQDNVLGMYNKDISTTSAQFILEINDKAVRHSKTRSTFSFSDQSKALLECAGKVSLTVVATQLIESDVTISYATRDGKAKDGQRYKGTQGTLKFGPCEGRKNLEIDIIDNETWTPPQEFYIDLFDLSVVGDARKVSLGCSTCTVWVLDKDEPGTLDFETNQVTVVAGRQEVSLKVIRYLGCKGRASCQYELSSISAILGQDVEDVSGLLEFQDGQEEATISIPVLNPSVTVSFRVTLKDPTEGIVFDKRTDGGEESAICMVTLEGPDEGRCLTCMRRFCLADPGETLLGVSQWQEKFPAAFYCNGSAEEQAEASCLDWLVHVLTLKFKVVFLVVPPPTLLGGWPAFIAALIMIGVVTVVVNDMASLLGCSMGMADDLTAITLVALGTSLPDTMASRTAAMHDDVADNSVGNVTGSNAVNVFLGLGISWTIGAVYWTFAGPTDEWQTARAGPGFATYGELYLTDYPQGGFIVPSGPLVFSVGAFTVGAVVTIVMLFVRRFTYGGELGGPRGAQIRDSSILFLLWVLFIVGNVVYEILSNS
eukprot:TRINITY_DN106487_c0_g1_i1.p1 TRINITY_DN106487_c0_g1~~TRINITY_DN106487_c0_g1_i1.p1  ORF type:complete len:1008 (-),score=176.18 TRINITY_DN106487_c0_g1_i1:147-3170(-)